MQCAARGLAHATFVMGMLLRPAQALGIVVSSLSGQSLAWQVRMHNNDALITVRGRFSQHAHGLILKQRSRVTEKCMSAVYRLLRLRMPATPR